MADTEIEWADKVWNFVRGCRRVSPGCGKTHEGGCYAERQAIRHAGPGGHYEGLVQSTLNGPRWTGKGRFVPEKLAEPLSWRRRKGGARIRCFVNSMSDLFFEEFSNEEIAAGFGVMAACPDVDFLILTKRAERMPKWFGWTATHYRGREAFMCLVHAQRFVDHPTLRDTAPVIARPWPLPNVWLGVSTEDQERADERIPHLLATPAAVRWISAEPLLGPIDVGHYLARCCERGTPALPGDTKCMDECCPGSTTHFVHGGALRPALDWIVVGGESGPGARPFVVDWARLIIAQCEDARVPCFMKQLGAHPVEPRTNGKSRFESFEEWVNKGRSWLDSTNALYDARDRQCRVGGDFMRARDEGAFPVRIFDALKLEDRKGGDPEEWPKFLDVRQFPEARP